MHISFFCCCLPQRELLRCRQEMRNLQAVKVREPGGRLLFVCLYFQGNLFPLCCFVTVQEAQKQRLCTQEASILQMKQELLRAGMAKDEHVNKNVRVGQSSITQ